MSGNARVTQEYAEALGADSGNARITQEIAEILGPAPSTARITQLYAEVLAPATPLDARITQLYAEPFGPPGSSGMNARITQLYAEILAVPINETPCRLPADLHFYGNATGLFYIMESQGAETVPVSLEDDYVNVGWANNLTVTQHLTVEETWIEWLPLAGDLQIKFASGNPVRTIWVVTNQARANPPLIPVWASAFRFDLWKQECDP